LDYRRPSSQLSVDRKPPHYLEDQDTSDDFFGDIMSPNMAGRRDSFAADSNGTMFSPQASMWDTFAAPVDRNLSISTTNPYYEQNSNNPFRGIGSSDAAAYGQQTAQWPPAFDRSGSRTPTTAHTYESFDSELNHPSSNAFMPAEANTAPAFHGLPMQNNVRPSSVFPPTQTAPPSMPTSPHAGQEWMTLAAQEMDSRPMPKRMRANSPPRSFSPFPRRDGIRKKNARFEIPAERNLTNIDDLISKTTDDEMLKELKQQKRLLRNRQAALDSRQRKKKHTEELEEEKKVWSDNVRSLEDQVASLRLQAEGHERERAQWQREHMAAQQQIETMLYEKEDMVRNHTLETGDLRKKISILSEKLEASTHAVAAPNASNFTDFTADMDGLNMNPDWDNYTFVNDDAYDFCMDSTPSEESTQAPPTNSIVLASRKKDPVQLSDADKPFASGLLLTLLLCGAFVASHSSGSSAPAIPRMPDDVRAASATVLDSIFKEAGVAPSLSQPPANLVVNHVTGGLEPRPSGVSWPKSTLSGAEFASLSTNPTDSLGQLHQQLAAPTKDQEAEQLFSMTPSQYNSLTSTEFNRRTFTSSGSETDEGMSPSTSQNRRNLAETLAAMRQDSKGDTAAEVYTRSLLWERIPSEVVRDFKRMVEQSGKASAS
ncbi:hypothetical protein K402DRAFT_311122, partial [Aulographum hederae CBS 113979]